MKRVNKVLKTFGEGGRPSGCHLLTSSSLLLPKRPRRSNCIIHFNISQITLILLYNWVSLRTTQGIQKSGVFESATRWFRYVAFFMIVHDLKGLY
eukprot:scaffold6136_cov197-Alexandrium_tamarense.AAC.6